MKKILLTTTMILISGLALTGCGTDDVVDAVAPKDAIYLIDQNGNGVSNVPYSCVDGNEGVTDGAGAFYFWFGTKCDLTMTTSAVDSLNDIVHLEEEDHSPLVGVPYICDSSTIPAKTNSAGIFVFDNSFVEDICTFTL